MARKHTVEILVKAKDETKKALDSAAKGFQKLNKSFTLQELHLRTLQALWVNYISRGIMRAYQFVDAVAAMEAELARVSRRIGTTTRTFASWEYALRSVGVSASGAEKAVKGLVDEFGTADVESGAAIKKFREMGLQLGLTGKDLDDLRQEFFDTGGGAVTAATDMGEAWEDAQRRIKAASTSINASLFTVFSPTLVSILEDTAEALAATARATEAFSKVGPPAGDVLKRFLEVLLVGKVRPGALPEVVDNFTDSVGKAGKAAADFMREGEGFNSVFLNYSKAGAGQLGPVAEETLDEKIARLNKEIAASLTVSKQWNASLKETTAAEEDLNPAIQANIQSMQDYQDAVKLFAEVRAELNAQEKETTEALRENEKFYYELPLTMLEAANAAQTFGNAVANIGGETVFAVMTGDIENVAEYIQNTLLGALQAVLVKLIAIKAVEAFGSLFGPANPISFITANLGQLPIGVKSASGGVGKSLEGQVSAAYASPYGPSGGSGGRGTVVMNVGIPESMAGLQRMQDSIAKALNTRGSI